MNSKKASLQNYMKNQRHQNKGDQIHFLFREKLKVLCMITK